MKSISRACLIFLAAVLQLVAAQGRWDGNRDGDRGRGGRVGPGPGAAGDGQGRLGAAGGRRGAVTAGIIVGTIAGVYPSNLTELCSDDSPLRCHHLGRSAPHISFACDEDFWAPPTSTKQSTGRKCQSSIEGSRSREACYEGILGQGGFCEHLYSPSAFDHTLIWLASRPRRYPQSSTTKGI